MAHSQINAYGYGGLIPFVTGAFAVWVFDSDSAYQIATYFLDYSAIILAFLSGMLWAGAILRQELHSKTSLLLGSSIAISLTAWFSQYVFIALHCALLMAGYIAIRKVENKTLDALYFTEFILMRTVLTKIVLASHISILVFLLQHSAP